MPEQAQQGGTVDVTLFVPCYNEEDNIAGTLATIEAAFQQVKVSYEVIVIDDASKDRSADKVKQFQARHPGAVVHLIVNTANAGLAANFREAARIGRGRFIRIVCGDNVEPVETQVAILSRLGQADMVIPFPLFVRNKTTFRLMLSRTYTRIINLLCGFRLRYWNGCALLRREYVVRFFPKTRGFGFQADLVSQLLCLGQSYVEVGCNYVERNSGTSKACTLKNLRSVTHVALRIVSRRVNAWLQNVSRWIEGAFRAKQAPLTDTKIQPIVGMTEAPVSYSQPARR